MHRLMSDTPGLVSVHRRQADRIPRHRRGGRRSPLRRAPGVRALDDGDDAAARRRLGALRRAAPRRDLWLAGAARPGARRRGSRARPAARAGPSRHRGGGGLRRPARVVRAARATSRSAASYLGFQPDRGQAADARHRRGRSTPGFLRRSPVDTPRSSPRSVGSTRPRRRTGSAAPSPGCPSPATAAEPGSPPAAGSPPRRSTPSRP